MFRQKNFDDLFISPYIVFPWEQIAVKWERFLVESFTFQILIYGIGCNVFECQGQDALCQEGLTCKSGEGANFGFGEHVDLCFNDGAIPALDFSHHDLSLTMRAGNLYGFSDFSFEVGNFDRIITKVKNIVPSSNVRQN